MLSCGSLRKQMSSTLLSCFKPTLNIFVRCRIVCPMTSSTVVQKIANQCSVQVLIEIILHKKYWSLCPLLQCGPKPDNGQCGGDILCRVSFFAFLFIRRRIKSKSQQGLWYIYIFPIFIDQLTVAKEMKVRRWSNIHKESVMKPDTLLRFTCNMMLWLNETRGLCEVHAI